MTALAGRVALVTGASRGIGAAAAEALLGAGARVVRAARSLSDRQTATRLDCRVDLTDSAQVEALARRVTDAWGTPDIVVNNAGSFLLAPLEQTSPAEFDAQLAANLRAPFLVARAFLPAMRERGGRLITVGSISDHRAFAENAAYAAAKFGLRGLHEVLREEYRATQVRCTLLSPGPTDTAVWDPVDPDNRPGFVPRHAMLRPEDVAEAILWLATRPSHVDVECVRMGPGSRTED